SIGQALIQNGFHQRVATGDNVANYIDIGLQLELFDAKALDKLNALFLQLRAHGWVDPLVAASNTVSSGAGDKGQPPHEGATNPQYMNVHAVLRMCDGMSLSSYLKWRKPKAR